MRDSHGGRSTAPGPPAATRSDAGRSVAAVVVHFGSWEPTRRCVASLRRTAPDASVLVVDNDPVSQAPDDLGVRIVKAAGNVGYGAGCNLGAAHAAGDLLLFANNDVEILPGTVARLRETVLSDDRYAAAGPRFLDAAGRPRRSIRLAPRPWRVVCENLMLPRLFPFVPLFRGHHTAFAPEGRPRPAETLLGALFLIRRAAFKDVGGFDESYFFYAEESDLFARLALGGWRLAYDPLARAVHHEGLASRSFPQATLDRWLHEGLRRYARRFHGDSGERRTLVALRAGAGIRWALSFVPGVPGRRERRRRYGDILRLHRAWRHPTAAAQGNP